MHETTKFADIFPVLKPSTSAVKKICEMKV